jgi:heme-degrading monooxygenase HmoA
VHLAQVNIAIPRAPTDSPQLAEFMAALDPINAIADRSPGFVWRLQTDDGNATSLRAYDDDSIMVNMSVWESLEALRAFVYASDHVGVMRRRREWFERMVDAYQGLWWVPVGHVPTVKEAEERLDQLRAHGPTPFAFTFREHFAPLSEEVIEDDRDACPA